MTKVNPKIESILTAHTETLSTLTTVSSQIRYLHNEGVSRGEISKVLSQHNGKEVRYQWVRNVLITPIKTQR